MLVNIIRNRKKTGIGGGGGGIVIDNGDPFYSAVSLLLPMDGTNGSTTFTDSGPNALAVTAVGNAQVSTTQSKYGGASAYFDGSGDYLSLGTQSQLDFGTGDFTVECWFQLTSTTNADQGILNDTRATFGTGSVLFKARQASGSGKICFQAYDFSSVGGRIVQSTTVPALNTWYHVALLRSSGTVRLFVNGVLESSGTWAGSVNFNYNNGTRIGHSILDGANGHFNGYMDDLRISRFARYVSNFTPPTAALPTIAPSTPADPYYGYTSLLLHMDGSSGSTNFVDSGPNALTVTASGDAQTSTTQSKYGGASAYFDGAGDYLDMSGTGVATAFGTGDFTIEFWYYPLSVSVQQNLVDKIGSASNAIYMSSAGVLKYYVGADRITGATLSANTWYHIALVRYSGVTKLYVIGVQSGASYTDTNNYALNTGSPRIGAAFNNTASVNGFIDDLRITKGVARYTSAFAPPAQAHLEFANGNDRHFSNVSLLLHMDGSNGSTTFTDNSSNARTITAVGNAQISTTQSQFGGSSAYFDGTGDYLSFTGGMPSGSGTAFTIECWIRLDDLSSYRAITRTAGGLDIGVQPNGLVNCDQTSVGIIANSATGVITAGTWYHIAVTRDTSNNYKIYVNGTQVASGTNSFSVTAATTIGFSVFSGAHYFKGYIDDFRATNVLRYTSNFTPSTSAFPNA